MIVLNYADSAEQLRDFIIPLGYNAKSDSERSFLILEDIKVVLSDGYEFVIKKNTDTDLASIPKALWSIFTPFDKALIADIIHDALWIDKIGQIQYFGSVWKAKTFADNERHLWRKKLAPEKKFKNSITNFVIRYFSTKYYIGKTVIPT